MEDAVDRESVTAKRPFLIDPPEADDDVRGIGCLDFDGVLNKIGPGRRDRLPQVVKDGRSWGIDLDAGVIARLACD